MFSQRRWPLARSSWMNWNWLDGEEQGEAEAVRMQELPWQKHSLPEGLVYTASLPASFSKTLETLDQFPSYLSGCPFSECHFDSFPPEIRFCPQDPALVSFPSCSPLVIRSFLKANSPYLLFLELYPSQSPEPNFLLYKRFCFSFNFICVLRISTHPKLSISVPLEKSALYSVFLIQLTTDFFLRRHLDLKLQSQL